MKVKLLITLLIFSLTVISSSCGADVEGQRKYIQPYPYEKQKWFGGDGGAEVRAEYRPQIARSLVTNGTLIGKPRSEVMQMLSDGINENEYDPETVNFVLEDIYQTNIDPAAIEYLEVVFDDMNRVAVTRIVFHKTNDWVE